MLCSLRACSSAFANADERKSNCTNAGQRPAWSPDGQTNAISGGDHRTVWTVDYNTLAVWLAIWLVPLFAVAAIFGPGHVLAQLAYFFSKLAVVTFGGAYAVLAYMAQEAVTGYQWLTAGEMLDGLGLAETTNGPLILVTESGRAPGVVKKRPPGFDRWRRGIEKRNPAGLGVRC